MSVSRQEFRIRRWTLTAAAAFVVAVFSVIPGIGPVPASYGTAAGRADRESSDHSEPARGMRSSVQVLRVATFNIHRGVGQDGRQELERTAQALLGIDVAGLHELGAAWGSRNQARTLGTMLGLDWAFGPTERTWCHATFGNGLVSRLPITVWRSTPFMRSSWGRTSGYLVAQLETGTHPVHLVVAHVEPLAMRGTQIEELARQFGLLSAPALLVGDFNTPASDPLLGPLLALAGVVRVSEDAAADGRAPIDHIFVKGLRVLGQGIVPTDASDHPVLWADVTPAEDIYGPPTSHDPSANTEGRHIVPSISHFTDPFRNAMQ